MNLNMKSSLWLRIFPTQGASSLEDQPLNFVHPSTGSCLLHGSFQGPHMLLDLQTSASDKVFHLPLICTCKSQGQIQERLLRGSEMLASSVLPAFLLTGSCSRTGRSPQHSKATRFGQGPPKAQGWLGGTYQELVCVMQCQTGPGDSHCGWEMMNAQVKADMWFTPICSRSHSDF